MIFVTMIFGKRLQHTYRKKLITQVLIVTDVFLIGCLKKP